MLQLRQTQGLQQRLTPQQVQYLKLLQLPILTLEQRIKSEIEENPMLEEASDEEEQQAAEQQQVDVSEPLMEAAGAPELVGEEAIATGSVMDGEHQERARLEREENMREQSSN
jgi:RNA polymerase sigma-54 factor